VLAKDGIRGVEKYAFSGGNIRKIVGLNAKVGPSVPEVSFEPADRELPLRGEVGVIKRVGLK